jgi:hypothetical protein
MATAVSRMLIVERQGKNNPVNNELYTFLVPQFFENVQTSITSYKIGYDSFKTDPPDPKKQTHVVIFFFRNTAAYFSLVHVSFGPILHAKAVLGLGYPISQEMKLVCTFNLSCGIRGVLQRNE